LKGGLLNNMRENLVKKRDGKSKLELILYSGVILFFPQQNDSKLKFNNNKKRLA
jgi:hypothetical protein